MNGRAWVSYAKPLKLNLKLKPQMSPTKSLPNKLHHSNQVTRRKGICELPLWTHVACETKVTHGYSKEEWTTWSMLLPYTSNSWLKQKQRKCERYWDWTCWNCASNLTCDNLGSSVCDVCVCVYVCVAFTAISPQSYTMTVVEYPIGPAARQFPTADYAVLTSPKPCSL